MMGQIFSNFYKMKLKSNIFFVIFELNMEITLKGVQTSLVVVLWFLRYLQEFWEKLVNFNILLQLCGLQSIKCHTHAISFCVTAVKDDIDMFTCWKQESSCLVERCIMADPGLDH